MVEGFCGLPGSGKTYWLAKQGLEAMKKGRKVYSNFKLEGALNYNDLSSLFDIQEGLILVDEINLLCPSRWWERFPPKLAYFWSQTRKMQLDIYWSAQHQDRVDKIIKEISNWIWEIRKFAFGFSVMNRFIPEQVGKVKREIFDTRIFHIDSRVWKFYNTYERIEVPAHLLKPKEYGSYNQRFTTGRRGVYTRF